MVRARKNVGQRRYTVGRVCVEAFSQIRTAGILLVPCALRVRPTAREACGVRVVGIRVRTALCMVPRSPEEGPYASTCWSGSLCDSLCRVPPSFLPALPPSLLSPTLLFSLCLQRKLRVVSSHLHPRLLKCTCIWSLGSQRTDGVGRNKIRQGTQLPCPGRSTPVCR